MNQNFILRRSGVVKNLIFEPDFQHKSKFFWILSNFILCWFGLIKTLIFLAKFSTSLKISGFCLHMSWVVKNVSFELSFQHKSKFLDFAKFHPSQGQEWSNSWYQDKFSTRLKISGFCQVSSFAGPKWSKISFLSQIFDTNQNFLDFVKFHPLLVCSGQNSHNLSQIFNATENFWILPNFILCMSWVFKTLKFYAKFSARLKISEFCQISSFAGSEWSKLS